MLTRAGIRAGMVAVCAAAGVALAGCGSEASPQGPQGSQSAQGQASQGQQVPQGQAPQGPPAAPSSGGPGSAGASAPAASGTAAPAGKANVSRQEAGRIATDKYGGQIKNVEHDHAKGRATWEVEIRNSHEGRIEVEVAQDNGEILDMEHD